MILSLIISLTLTLIIEITMSIILGIKEKYDLIIVVLANCITNPVVVFIANCVNRFNIQELYVIVVSLLEISAVLVEFIILKKYLKYNKKSPFIISLINNITSFSIGLIITKFI